MSKELKIERLQQENKKLKEDIKTLSEASKFISAIQELDQDKTYAIKIKNKKEAQKFIGMIEHVKRTTPWTLPQFILINSPIEELSIEKLKKTYWSLKNNEKRSL